MDLGFHKSCLAVLEQNFPKDKDGNYNIDKTTKIDATIYNYSTWIDISTLTFEYLTKKTLRKKMGVEFTKEGSAMKFSYQPGEFLETEVRKENRIEIRRDTVALYCLLAASRNSMTSEIMGIENLTIMLHLDKFVSTIVENGLSDILSKITRLTYNLCLVLCADGYFVIVKSPFGDELNVYCIAPDNNPEIKHHSLVTRYIFTNPDECDIRFAIHLIYRLSGITRDELNDIYQHLVNIVKDDVKELSCDYTRTLIKTSIVTGTDLRHFLVRKNSVYSSSNF